MRPTPNARPSPARHLAGAALAAGLVAAAGCQTPPQGTRADVNDAATPIAVDPAMALRDWPPTQAEYQGGRTVAGATGFGYESSPTRDADAYNPASLVVDPAIFLLNVVTAPFTLAAQGFGPQVSSGVEVPPTYTAAPVVPDDPEPYDYGGGAIAGASGTGSAAGGAAGTSAAGDAGSNGSTGLSGSTGASDGSGNATGGFGGDPSGGAPGISTPGASTPGASSGVGRAGPSGAATLRPTTP